MKKFFAFFLLFAGLILSASAYAVDFDGGGQSSTLDNEEAAYGEDPNQGTWHAEANS